MTSLHVISRVESVTCTVPEKPKVCYVIWLDITARSDLSVVL